MEVNSVSYSMGFGTRMHILLVYLSAPRREYMPIAEAHDQIASRERTTNPVPRYLFGDCLGSKIVLTKKR